MTIVADATDAGLRAARRQRALDALDQAGIDVAVLGRRDSIAYVTGARGLWTAGTRPFGAACVVVVATGSIHLLSSWDAGVPEEIGFEALYGVTWNPAVMGASLRGIPGVRGARRLGVDALSPGFQRAAARLAPAAEVVPVDDLLREVRAIKLPGELDRMAAAAAVVRGGFDAGRAAVESGEPPSVALRAAIEALATAGVTVPTSGPVLRALGDGLVHLDLGMLVEGYEGGLGRTFTVDGAAPPGLATLARAHGRLIDACRPAATGADLRSAAREVSTWTVRGAGMGVEPPLATPESGGQAEIAAGMVLSVEVEVGDLRQRDLVVVGRDGPRVF